MLEDNHTVLHFASVFHRVTLFTIAAKLLIDYAFF
jgi:hypothetical protein